MPPSSRALLSLVLLIIAGSYGAFSSRQEECIFPLKWEGTWFQSGVRQPILISRNELSSKGTCLRNEGDKFLLYDKKSCYRCVVIHEKHSNVLQYKETYCHNKNTLASLCSYITGDALLYSMFREDAPSVPCPFRGPMTFSYNRGHGTCSSPQSNVDTCTDDSRLLFRYQACPDVPASESAVEELECLATWKEGSSRYLVGRLHHGHASSNEDRYRCFVYEKAGQTVQGSLNRAVLGMATMDHEVNINGATAPVPEGASEIYRVAQSGDATCNGLFSAMEGSRTMTLKKVSSPGECRFPSWLTGHTSGGLTWHTLDLARSYTFHPRNASLHVTRVNTSSSRYEAAFSDSPNGLEQEGQTVKILCNSIKQSSASQAMTMIVAHFTVGCQSGYMCMVFYRRDGHVIEVQTGSPVSRPEEACSSSYFQENIIPYLTLVTSSPEPRQCPYLGKFTVTGVNQNQRNTRDNKKGQLHQETQTSRREREKVRHGEDHRGGRKMDFEIETRRANNEYLIRERLGRRARSNRYNGIGHRDGSNEDMSTGYLEEMLSSHGPGHGKVRKTRDISRLKWSSRTGGTERVKVEEWNDRAEEKSALKRVRMRRSSAREDFQVDQDEYAQIRQFWAPEFDDSTLSAFVQAQADYFGEYPETENLPKKRSPEERGSSSGMTYDDLVRMRRDLDGPDRFEDSLERREKREEEETRCSSEVTTLNIGCSTADRMEFRTDCEDFITAYSCHGRWFDAEGTQFVIATPLARRPTWTSENNRPQPYRNTRRLCFMYKESGGVVSLTASPIACQRGVPPPPPLLAFNATSIGQCMEDSSNVNSQAHLTILIATVIVAIFR
ncbi:uncharacterized protein [Prorops nasuta]|uniref:uncharacterized protein isoform X2 n=1 Tax=Prorops nasuta TaxID=863751 RepID=UPI0034CFC45F